MEQPETNPEPTNAVERFEAGLTTAKLGVMIAVAGLTMMFGALAIMYLSRHGDRLNYPFSPPGTLWVSTVLLLASSLTFRGALRAAKAEDDASLRRNVSLTLALGVAFVVSQVVAWVQLSQAGAFGQTNPFRNLFYILTGVHGFHVLLGIVWLAWCRSKANQGYFSAGNHQALELSSLYWHFMDITWIAFFALLMLA
jgi:cytochrome c oxidase subunit 3